MRHMFYDFMTCLEPIDLKSDEASSIPIKTWDNLGQSRTTEDHQP